MADEEMVVTDPEQVKARSASPINPNARHMHKQPSEILAGMGHNAAEPVKSPNPKDAFGVKKPSLSNVSLPVLMEVALGMTEGAFKYGRHNYRDSAVLGSVYFDAAIRHLFAWFEGEDIDKASGVHHVSKAIASLTVLRDAMLHDKFIDDRPPHSKEGWLSGMDDKVAELMEKYPEPKKPYTAKGNE